jgi:hypothetical protein
MTVNEKRLQEVMNAYGRNPLRWPEADRVRFAHLLRQPGLVPDELGSDADQLDKLLDLAGPQAIAEPQGARARLLQRVAAEAQITSALHADAPRVTGWRRAMQPQALVAAGMLAASIVVGVFVGINAETGALLADSLQLPSPSDELLDVVLLDEGEDGGLL